MCVCSCVHKHIFTRLNQFLFKTWCWDSLVVVRVCDTISHLFVFSLSEVSPRKL